MEGESQEEEKQTGKGDQPRPGRTWTERFVGPIRYHRYSAIDAGGKPRIIIKVEEPIGESELAKAVYGAIKELRFVHLADGRSRPNEF